MSSRSSDDSISTLSDSPKGILLKKSTTTIEDISSIIAYILQQIITDNELKTRELDITQDNYDILENKNTDIASIFIGNHTPTVTIENFVRRIIRYCKLEKSTLVLSLIYIDRYCEYSKVILSKKNIHRIVLLSILTAMKYNEDEKCGFAYYSKVGGVTADELSHLELFFLIGIEFTLFVNEYVFEKYESYINKFIAL